MRKAGHHRHRLFPVYAYLTLPWLLMLPAVVFAGHATWDLWRWRPELYVRKDSPKEIQDALNTLSGELKVRTDELKWTLTAIGLVAGFIAIAQGATAFFSAKAFTEEAKKKLDEIDQSLEEVQQRYPLFRSIETLRKKAFDDLDWDISSASRRQNPEAEPTEVLDYEFLDILYAGMDVEKRQRLLSVESFASIDLDAGTDGETTHHEKLRRLALFYQSKFRYEQNAGAGSFADLERAEGYLKLAAKKSGGDFTIWNDLSNLCLQIYMLLAKSKESVEDTKNHYLDEAEKATKKSLGLESNQQRALYNRGKVHARRKQFALAVQDLADALGKKNWQRYPPISSAKALTFYNFACYQAQVLSSDSTKSGITAVEAEGCLNALKDAARYGGVRERNLIKDFEPGGDMHQLLQKADDSLKVRLNTFRAQLVTTKPVSQQNAFSRSAAFKEARRTYHRVRQRP